MTSYGDPQKNERECIANATLVSLFAYRFPAGRWSFLEPGSEIEVVFYFHCQTTRRMGQSRWIDDDQIRRKRTPSFPSHEVKIIGTLLCRWGND